MYQLKANAKHLSSPKSAQYPYGLAWDNENEFLYTSYRHSNTIYFKRYQIDANQELLEDSTEIPSIDSMGTISKGTSLAIYEGMLYVAFRQGDSTRDESIFLSYLDISALEGSSPQWITPNGTAPDLIENWPSEGLSDGLDASKYPSSFSPTTDESPVLLSGADGNLHLAAKTGHHSIAYGWYNTMSGWRWNQTDVSWVEKDGKAKASSYRDYNCSLNIPHPNSSPSHFDFMKTERNPTMVSFGGTIYIARKYNYATQMVAYPIYLAKGEQTNWTSAYEAYKESDHGHNKYDFSQYTLNSDPSKALPGTLFTFGPDHSPETTIDNSLTPVSQLAPALVNLNNLLVMVYINPDSKTIKDYQDGSLCWAYSIDSGATWTDCSNILNSSSTPDSITVDNSCHSGPNICMTGNSGPLILSVVKDNEARLYSLQMS